MTSTDRSWRRLRRLWQLFGVAALVGVAFAANARDVALAAPGPWEAAWAASPMSPTPKMPNPANAGFANQTVRNIVYTSSGGNQARVRLSNVFGAGRLRVGALWIGVELTGARLVPGSSHQLTFAGHRSVTVPPGAEVVSDPVAMSVSPQENLAISLYLPVATGQATYHASAQQTTYIASGNHPGDVGPSRYTTTATSWYFNDEVEVRNARTPGTVIALGDSITDGAASQVNANARWPNFLARRLNAAFGAQAPSVVDEGIGGNRVLNDSPCFGVNALARLDRDVLSVTGARSVILLEGINDIGFSQTRPGPDDTTLGPGGTAALSFACFSPNTNVSASEIEAGYQQIISRAHLRGLKIFGGTLTPFKGAFYWSPAAEAKREAVNRWILSAHAFDGVIDFAKAVEHPFDRLYMNPAYNSGDNLHPNDAGYQAMANAVNLGLLR